jgi:hypothetical protein
MAFWYLAHADELLLDVDGADVQLERGGTRLEMFCRRRLRDGIVAGLLKVKCVTAAASYTPGHLHVCVTLHRPMPTMERLIWQSWLGSDLYRSRADLMRAHRGHAYPSLLIAPDRYPRLRDPDAVCSCAGKHPTVLAEGVAACPVWAEYRGPSPWECFGAPSTRPDEGVRVALRVGRWSLDDILRV